MQSSDNLGGDFNDIFFIEGVIYLSLVVQQGFHQSRQGLIRERIVEKHDIVNGFYLILAFLSMDTIPYTISNHLLAISTHSPCSIIIDGYKIVEKFGFFRIKFWGVAIRKHGYLFQSDEFCHSSVSHTAHFGDFPHLKISPKLGCLLLGKSFIDFPQYIRFLFPYLLNGSPVDSGTEGKVTLRPPMEMEKFLSHEVLFHKVWTQAPHKGLNGISDDFTELKRYLALLGVTGVNQGKFIDGFGELYESE